MSGSQRRGVKPPEAAEILDVERQRCKSWDLPCGLGEVVTAEACDSPGHSPPLDRVYPVMFIDAIHVKIRDGQVAKRPIYVAVGVTVEGERDILGLWACGPVKAVREPSAHHVLTEIRNRVAIPQASGRTSCGRWTQLVEGVSRV